MSRNLAIYDDKIFLATSDTRMVALDATTGELQRTTRFGDIAQGHQSTSGPLVMRGTIMQEINGCEGFPVSFQIDGSQYNSVSTGLGGGSPRLGPASLAPEIHYPQSGNALHVFRLRD